MTYPTRVLFAALAASALMPVAAWASEDPKAGANAIGEMKTSHGTIKIELFQHKVPITVQNFLSYVDDRFYDGTVFHRVIESFMIQGGGFDDSDPMRQKRTKPPIKNEAANGLKNERGTIAMARTSMPNSATSQFFINVVDNDALNRGRRDPNGYAVFGKVIDGMDLVDKIRKVKTAGGRAVIRQGDREIEDTMENVPETKVVIESVRRVEPKK